MLRLIPRIFIAQMVAADCIWLAIFVVALIAYRRKAVSSLLLQLISAAILLACNLLTQSLQVAETFYNFQFPSQSANTFNNVQGGIVIASMVGFAIGFCWYHLRHANRESLRGFPIHVPSVVSKQGQDTAD